MRYLLAALMAAGLAGPVHADLSFECQSVHSRSFAPCSEPVGAFKADLGPLDSYLVTFPNGHVSKITLTDETWAAGGTYELVFLDSFSLVELYLYGTGSGGFTTRLWYTYGGPDTTGAANDWQALGTWAMTSTGPTSLLPEPGTLAIVALALAAAGLARRGH